MNRRNFFGMLFGAAAVGAVVSLPAQSTTTAVTMDDRRRAGLILVDRDGVRANKETLFL
jgi:hypothetical protein